MYIMYTKLQKIYTKTKDKEKIKKLSTN